MLFLQLQLIQKHYWLFFKNRRPIYCAVVIDWREPVRLHILDNILSDEIEKEIEAICPYRALQEAQKTSPGQSMAV